jgi:hypothetical protein
MGEDADKHCAGRNTNGEVSTASVELFTMRPPHFCRRALLIAVAIASVTLGGLVAVVGSPFVECIPAAVAILAITAVLFRGRLRSFVARRPWRARSEDRRPRFRFGLRMLMALPVLAGLLLWMLSFLSVETGPADIPIVFVVLDAKTGLPIPFAQVWLCVYGTSSARLERIAAGPDGRAERYNYMGWRGVLFGFRRSPFRTTRTVDYGDWEAIVSAEGFEDARFKLRDRAWDRRYDENAAPTPIVVRLQRESAGGAFAQGRMGRPSSAWQVIVP